MKANAIETRRWTREEYDKMIAAGVFSPGERVELVDGEILQMAPQGSLHATAVRLAEDALRKAFGHGFDVRTQLPLALSPDSEPEPDVAVVTGSARDYSKAHPATAVLVVEVAEATLEFDRLRKGSVYARGDIPEYWIVNLIDRCLEIYRDPRQGSYRSRTRLLAGETVSPLAAAHSRVAVADFLP